MTAFWESLIAAATFATVIIGAVWAVMQAQLRSLNDQRRIKEKCFEEEISALREDIRSLCLQQVGKDVFREFKTSYDQMTSVLRSQLTIVELTRPTTGELKSTADSVLLQVNKIEERLRQIEQNMLRQAAAVAVAAAKKNGD